jgi:hypothetical protein
LRTAERADNGGSSDGAGCSMDDSDVSFEADAANEAWLAIETLEEDN